MALENLSASLASFLTELFSLQRSSKIFCSTKNVKKMSYLIITHFIALQVPKYSMLNILCIPVDYHTNK